MALSCPWSYCSCIYIFIWNQYVFHVSLMLCIWCTFVLLCIWCTFVLMCTRYYFWLTSTFSKKRFRHKWKIKIMHFIVKYLKCILPSSSEGHCDIVSDDNYSPLKDNVRWYHIICRKPIKEKWLRQTQTQPKPTRRVAIWSGIPHV